MRHRLAAALLSAIPCVAAVAGPAWAAEAIPCEQVASIGVATMAADGTITMRIRSLPPGPIAEGLFTYLPTDPKYEDIKKHLGGLLPGETKMVPPWC